MRIPSGVTDQYIYFVAVDSTDLKTRETGLSGFTVYRSRNGGAAAAMTTPTVNETDSTNMPGVYELLLDEDMTIDSGDDSQEMVFHITVSGMAPVTRTIELYRPKITAGNTLGVAADGDLSGNVDGNVVGSVASVTAQVTANVTAISGDTTAADNLELDYDGTGYNKANSTIGTTTTNTDMRGTDSAYTGTPPTAAAIADAVLDEALSGHASAGTLGKAVSDIEADTAELQTDNVPGLIAALNDISTAQVNAEVDTALADYDAPTKAELDAGLAALNDIAVSDVLTTQMTESYNSDGSAPTLAQALHLIIAYLMERSVAGTTVTAKKLDGSTTAATFTLDDGTSPTSVTRAT